MRLNLAALAVVACGILPGSLPAAEWGNLGMRFVFGGEPPTPQRILVEKGRELLDETLVVNGKDRGIANVVVWIEAKPGEKLPVHPSYEASAGGDVAMAFERSRLTPHIVFLRTTQTFKLVNRDQVAFSPKWDFFELENPPNSVTLGPMGTIARRFSKAEASPTLIECAIHPWLRGYALIRDNPYMAASDASGKLAIANLPAGKHTLRVWHESVTGWAIKQASHAGASVDWPRGRMTLEIKPGENDLDEFKLSPEIFRR